VGGAGVKPALISLQPTVDKKKPLVGGAIFPAVIELEIPNKGGKEMNFNEKLQALRKEKGLTQEELAEKLDVSRQAVSKWEAEQAMPEIDNLIGLANIYGVSMDYLLTGKEFEDTSAPKIQIVHVKPKISIRVLLGSVFLALGAIGLVIMYIIYTTKITQFSPPSFWNFMDAYRPWGVFFLCVFFMLAGLVLLLVKFIMRAAEFYKRQKLILKLIIAAALIALAVLVIAGIINLNQYVLLSNDNLLTEVRLS
jgi:transcriptional regulator with XRE-family HTH domain